MLLQNSTLLKPSGLIRFCRKNMLNTSKSRYADGTTVKTRLRKDPNELSDRSLKFIRFWTSKNGRYFSMAVMFTGSMVAGAIPLLKNSYFLPYIRDIFQQLRGGFPVGLDRTIRKEMVPSVMNDLELSSEDVAKLKIFFSTDAEPFSNGELGSEALIGLPFWFPYTDPKEVPVEQMNFNKGAKEQTKDNENLTIEARERLASGLTLPLEAKKFAIARELVSLGEFRPQYKEAFLGSLSVFLCYMASKTANDRLGLWKQARALRLLNYAVTTNISLLFYFNFKDYLRRSTQGQIDERVAKISPEYAKGGVIFYNKQMERNSAKRELIANGESLYNRNGEEVYALLRRRNKFLSERREICQAAFDAQTSS
eukprot:TRINITY_DN4338_c0_g1_i1.p1 TRINITY_DN4338_c0_g1~~TRINITY_DN4338_c0_g1_i1.p1  ORF type:complete len:368 (-),score=41.56 TRINITY_DN4338_c0_g1_i1:428-1531(-)